ncbi:MAG: DegT/DnrJ/EryC1/StrS family aminotransferase [Prolixibacteraceae bacterium]
MEKLKKPIFVTRPALPPLDEFTGYLEKIWDNRILTNNGPFHRQFEKELAAYLGVQYISVFANGTLALMTALQALRISGEVITSPFSFVATTHALWWNNIKPVFVDIEPRHFTLDPAKIEAAITPKTTAIMPVHVYGNPCRMQPLQEIADTYGLRLIYDAAHTFGVRVNGETVLNSGDLSILSFHATKVFNTIEGGAIVSPDEKTKKRIDYLKNFGFAGETTVIEPGINAKMNEIQAAYGLLQLKHIDGYIAKRRRVAEGYRARLKGIPGIRYMDDTPGVRHNYSYFPILVDRDEYGMSRDELYEKLKRNQIMGRRYFYPLISQFPTYRGLPSAQPENLPVAENVSRRVICLPMYPDLTEKEIEEITEVIRP